MRLHDTASGALQEVGSGPGPVGIYVCGITPYDASHLGHAFTFHVFDVITRRLRAQGREVRSVRNITDVDDDMLRTARQRGVDYRALGDAEVTRFDAEMGAINMLPVTSPRATEHVSEMAAMVAELERRGQAYAVDGWVFFDTRRDPSFGSFSRLQREAMIRLSGERGADPADPRKRDPLDFVLWQRSAEGEPAWPSAWGAGRPGWHIECSVLSTGALGSAIDIHGGGEDLVFPHHEAEIAQARAAGVTPFVRTWVHIAPVMLGGEKMSKSLGNLVFTGDLVREASAPAVRLMLADHHHRRRWSYDAAELRAAGERWARYRHAQQGDRRFTGADAEQTVRAFLERVDDDLDTPGALAVLDAAASRAGEGGVPAADVLSPLLEMLGAVSPA